MVTRRGFLRACLAAATAPYVVTTAGILMPVRPISTVTVSAFLAELWGPELLRRFQEDSAAWKLWYDPSQELVQVTAVDPQRVWCGGG